MEPVKKRAKLKFNFDEVVLLSQGIVELFFFFFVFEFHFYFLSVFFFPFILSFFYSQIDFSILFCIDTPITCLTGR